MAQKEFCEKTPVLDDNGRSVLSGWARTGVFTYNSEKTRGSRQMKFAQDRYALFSPTHIFTFDALDDGSLGNTRVTISSKRDKRQFQYSRVFPFPLGRFALPDSPASGDIILRLGSGEKDVFDFITLKPEERLLKIDIPHFSARRSLRGEVVLSRSKDAESLFTCQAWPGERNSFQYTMFSPAFTVEGVMQFESADIVFSRGNGWGILDWRRGVRPKHENRLWAAASGQYRGKTLSFCAGYGTASAAEGSENAFFVNGKLHKLAHVSFHASSSDWMKIWLFTSSDKRLTMTFEPREQFEHQASMGLHAIRSRLFIGEFSGSVILDDGSPLEFKNITGLAERHNSRF